MPGKPRPKLHLLWRTNTLTKRDYKRGRRFAIVARRYGLARAVAETRARGIARGTATDAIVADGPVGDIIDYHLGVRRLAAV